MSESNQSDADTLVRFVRHADETNGTAVLTFPDTRPDLPIGGAGYVTHDELHSLVAMGVVLETISKAKAREEDLLPPEEEIETPLTELPMDELRAMAQEEGADITGLRSKVDVAAAISAHRLGQDAGAESLPPTATTGTGESLNPTIEGGPTV